MNFAKLTDNALKLLDRYVYGPMGRSLERVGDVFLSDKFVKLVAAPSVFILIVLVFYSLFALAKYEHDNPCLEWVETGEQVCSTHCVNTGQHSPPICNTNCSPKKECTVRQMADGTVQTR
jgi:hypothetical protein